MGLIKFTVTAIILIIGKFSNCSIQRDQIYATYASARSRMVGTGIDAHLLTRERERDREQTIAVCQQVMSIFECLFANIKFTTVACAFAVVHIVNYNHSSLIK